MDLLPLFFEGEGTAAKAVVDWCKNGPDMARVDDLQVEWGKSIVEFKLFFIH